MRLRHWIVCLLVLSLFLIAPTCSVVTEFKILAPTPGATVATPTITITIQTPTSDFTLTGATLNLQPLALTGAAPLYSASVGVGDPLLDENVVIAKGVRTSDGKILTRGVEFTWDPACPNGKASVRQMTAGDLLSGGPLVHNRVGDYLLENCAARFVVQDVGQRDLYSVGAFGGNLIDAELVASPGRDNFLEFQPMANVETVFNATTATIINDGQNGQAAVLEVCGPDDLLDFVNPSSQVFSAGIPFPAALDDNDQDIEGCTRYTLGAGVDTHVRVDTEVSNNEAGDLRLLVGDWMNGGGELEQWSTPGQGVGAGLFDVLDTLSFFGFGENIGVDYQYFPIPLPAPLDTETANYFSTSGVTIILHNESIIDALTGGVPPFVVPAGGANTYSRVFGVGDGSGSNVIVLENAIESVPTETVSGCASVNGVPTENMKLSFGTDDGMGVIDQLESTTLSRAGACPNYEATLPVAPAGTYLGAAAKAGHPYENGVGDPNPLFKPVDVSGGPAVVNFDLPQTGRICVTVTDESSDPLPARVTVVGFDPSPDVVIPGTAFLGFSGEDLGLFNDQSDTLPFGIVDAQYTGAAGTVDFDIEPGTYQVVVSRGTEYSISQHAVTVAAGACSGSSVIAAQLTRVVDTTGFISSDFHVHGIRSADSRITDNKRVTAFAAENIENPVMTDHHVHTDLGPTITANGLDAFLTATVGEEITTFDYGHFNGYPFTIDTSKPSGGSTDWAGAAPAGMDFPSFGNYNLRPAEIRDLALAGSPQSTPGVTTVQINHIGSHFDPMRIDTSAATIFANLNAVQRSRLRLPPGDPLLDNLFAHFPALELWNGYTRGHALDEFLNDRIGIWFNHLNAGLLTTAIADTDTHRFVSLRTAGARSWTASPSDAIAGIDPADVAASVSAGRVVGGQGLYVQARLVTSAGTADLGWGGVTEIGDDDGNVTLEIDIQSPSWAQWDNVKVYANASTVVTKTNGTIVPVNTLFTAGPPQAELVEGDCDPATDDLADGGDFDITEVTNVNGVAGANRWEASLSVPFSVSEDTWFVVVVQGSDGACEPMFPVYPASIDDTVNTTLGDLTDGNLGENGVLALGYTNALYLDLDGGGFQGPNE